MRLASSAHAPPPACRGTIARLHPTHAQHRGLEAEERRARWVWNRTVALGRRLRGRGARLTFATACTRLTRWRGRRPWLTESSVVVQQQVVKAAADALAAWYAGTRRRPRFKSARRGDAVALRYTARGLGAVTETHVSLAKLGAVRHGATRALYPVSSVDLVRDRKGWLVAFRERVPADAIPPADPAPSGHAVGLDFGVAQTWTLSTGEAMRVPVLDPDGQRTVRRLDRQLDRRRRPKGQRPSRRYTKTRAERARLHRRIAARRQDALRKLARQLAAAYALIAVEDLQLAAMTRRARGRGRRAKAALNRALLAQSRGELVRALASACRWTGAQHVAVPAPYTSQTCPACGHVAPENRESQAVFRCRACGLHGHADVIAATNIRRRGVRLALLGIHDPSTTSTTTGDGTPGGERRATRVDATNRDPAEPRTVPDDGILG